MLFQNNKSNPDPVDGRFCRHCCIKINELTVRFGENTILDRVNLHVHCGVLPRAGDWIIIAQGVCVTQVSAYALSLRIGVLTEKEIGTLQLSIS